MADPYVAPPEIVKMPKIELHVHLEGSMSVATVQALTAKHDADPSSVWPGGFPTHFSFDGFPDFAAQFFYGLSLLRSGEDLVTVAEDLARSMASQNVRYAEVTTTAFTHFMARDDRPGMSPHEYRDGLNEGRRRAASHGVDMNWVIDIPRDIETPDSTVTIDYLESGQTPDGLVAIGLGGYEVGFPALPYAPHFQRAQAIGLHSVPHAGDTEGAQSVRSAMDDLGAERVGHGVRCLEDPDLVRELVDRGIMLEVCPTSNDLLQVIETLENHPLPQLVDAGLRVCINTDDPGWFDTDLTTELAIATELLGVSFEDHVAMQRDAISASFASADQKVALRNELSSL